VERSRPGLPMPDFSWQTVSMKERGLALVELLVVVAVIIVLLGLSLPVLRQVRGQVRSTVCRSNLSQLMVEFLAYEATHGVLPFGLDTTQSDKPPGGIAGNLARNPLYDPFGWWWFHCLGLPTPRPFSTQPTILRCPSALLVDPGLKNNILYGNYGVNWSICKSPRTTEDLREFKGRPLSTSSMTKASETLLILDSGYALIAWYHATADPPHPWENRVGYDASYVPGLPANRQRALLPGQQDDALNGRHGTRYVNAGFVDGHVERRWAQSLGVRKTEEGYSNLRPLWTPKVASSP
jgi:prepilin-type processing-associated H-X9-DG protein